MEQVRLIQVVPTLRCGGAERMVVNLTAHLDRQRFEVGIVSLAPSEGGPLERSLSEGGHRLWFLGKRRGFDPLVPFRIRGVVRRFRPHLVHSHLCLHYVFPALVGCSRTRHVTTVHLPGDTRYARVVLPLSRMAFRRGVIPIAVSSDVRDWVKLVAGMEECLTIPNGIPLADYRRPDASRWTWRRELGVGDDDVALVCVARLEEQKNHRMLLQAFAAALRAEPRARLLLVGDGRCRQALELLARELTLEDKVRFLGQRSDVPRMLAAADVFVLASQNEGNPLALMEAMAAGLPVVATAVGGVPELIVDRQSGLLVPRGDCDGLAAAMLRLCRHAEMRHAMGARAADQALRTFSASRMAQAYAELYARVLTETRSATAQLRQHPPSPEQAHPRPRAASDDSRRAREESR